MLFLNTINEKNSIQMILAEISCVIYSVDAFITLKTQEIKNLINLFFEDPKKYKY